MSGSSLPPVASPEVDIPGDLRLAGFCGTVPGEPGRLWVRTILPDKPYYYSNNDSPKDTPAFLRFSLQDFEGREIWRKEAPCPNVPWQEISLPRDLLTTGTCELEAVLIYDDLPMARVTRTLVLHAPEGNSRFFFAESMEGWGDGICQKLSDAICGTSRTCLLPAGGTMQIPVVGDGLVAVYGLLQIPTGTFRVEIGENVVSHQIEDFEFVAREVFFGFGKEGQMLRLRTENGSLGLIRIRMEPLDKDDEALAGWHTPKTRDRRVVVNNDGYSEGFFEPLDWNPKQLAEQILRFQGSGVSQVDLCSLVSDTANYPSDWVDFHGMDPAIKWPREGDRSAHLHYRWLAENTKGLFPVVLEAGRTIDLTVGGSLRMNVSYGHHPFGRVMNGKFWFDYPSCRIKRFPNEIDDNENSLSFAYPEVRARRVGVLRELAEFGCLEVNLDFCRYPRIMGYDEPLLEIFFQRHGSDGREVEIDDPHWIRIRQEVMTDFLRDIRQSLNEVKGDDGEKVRISIRLPATKFESFGFDPAAWIAEDLVDTLIPAFPGHDRWCDVTPWVDMTRNAPVQVLAGIEYFRHQTSESELTDEEVARGVVPGRRIANTREDFLRRGAEAYAKGADGMYVFNVWDNPELLEGLQDASFVRHWHRFRDLEQWDAEVRPSRAGS